MKVTPADATLLRVLEVLTATLPSEKRAAHLARRCAELAARIEAELQCTLYRETP